jgi:hypothetical protein
MISEMEAAIKELTRARQKLDEAHAEAKAAAMGFDGEKSRLYRAQEAEEVAYAEFRQARDRLAEAAIKWGDL